MTTFYPKQTSIFQCMIIGLFLLSALTFIGCQEDPSGAMQQVEIINPTPQNSRFPYLHTAEDGDLYMSWVQKEDTLSSLWVARYGDEGWGSPKSVAEAGDWFVNWADFPAVHRFGENGLATHYLQKSGGDTYAYDVKLRVSNDQGENWSEAIRPHDDGTQTEHGFVSMFETSDNHLGMVWLDGRKYGEEAEGGEHAHHGHGGEMTLRFGSFDELGNKLDETLLDDRVCDCCQTDVAMTSEGPIVVYRNRSDEEIRDMFYVKQVDGKWTEPQNLSADEWQINGCPVNGPAITATEEWVAAAWFNMVGNVPMVQMSFSSDAGNNFMPAVQIDEGNPTGRVDILLLEDRSAVVSWIEQRSDSSAICLRKVSPSGALGKVYTVSSVSAERGSGFPRMTLRNEVIWIAWTDVEEETTNVEMRKIVIAELGITS